MFPFGTDGFASVLNEIPGKTASAHVGIGICPSWPPDLFAVVASIIERSGCYTLASPDRTALQAHAAYLDGITRIAKKWNRDVLRPPNELVKAWTELIGLHGRTGIGDVSDDRAAVHCLLKLFAIADEASVGMGWDVSQDEAAEHVFASIVLLNLPQAHPASGLMPYLPNSLCINVPPDTAIVLPKSITPSVGCTVRSLSHHLALLPAKSVIASSWTLSSIQPSREPSGDAGLPYDIRLLLLPFPFRIPADSFLLSSPRLDFARGNPIPAYFTIAQRWLASEAGEIDGGRLAEELLLPLIRQAAKETGRVPHGVVLPECALSSPTVHTLVEALVDSGIEFLISGVLDVDPLTGKVHNRAKTFIIRPSENGVAFLEQNKHHRWRLDRQQTTRYALDFDPDKSNGKWWEDIDIGQRKLPFFALRKDMSATTLICEDLARTDPVMTAIRSVGPNLVVALLMDGPQLAARWPGRYATVLAEDPGSAVLTLTNAAMVDRANWLETTPARSIGLWRDADGTTQEIGLPPGSLAIALTLQSDSKQQNTLDHRSDHTGSRQLSFRTMVPLFLAKPPAWL